MTSYNSTMHVVLWLKGALPLLSNEVGQIPSYIKLAALKPCGVSTIRKAMKQLESEGFIASKHGYGTFLLNNNQSKITSPNNIQLPPAEDSIRQSNRSINQKTTIALLIPITFTKDNLHSSVIQYLSFISAGATQAANRLNCELAIHFYEQDKAHSEKSINRFIHYIKHSSCSAVLLASITEDYAINKIASTGIPGIILDHWAPTSTNWLSLLPNHFQAFREMVLVLAQLQHKRIVLIDREDSSKNPSILEGYQSGLKKVNLNYDEKLTLKNHGNRSSFDRLTKKLLRLLKSKEKPTALIIQSHNIIPGLIQALSSKGYSIPKDLSIITLGPEMDLIKHFKITGYKVDWNQIGQMAIHRAVDLINNKPLSTNTEYFNLDYVAGNTISFYNKK